MLVWHCWIHSFVSVQPFTFGHTSKGGPTVPIYSFEQIARVAAQCKANVESIATFMTLRRLLNLNVVLLSLCGCRRRPRSLLLLGGPGVGVPSLLADMCGLMSLSPDQGGLGLNVLLLDTTGEIAGTLCHELNSRLAHALQRLL